MVTHDLAEAITMSDRVIVLSKRPALVKKVFDIYFEERNNTIELRKTKKFYEYYEDIWKEIDNHV